MLVRMFRLRFCSWRAAPPHGHAMATAAARQERFHAAAARRVQECAARRGDGPAVAEDWHIPWAMTMCRPEGGCIVLYAV